MKPRIFYCNEKGNVEFTKEELEKLIDDIYDEGKSDGMRFNQVQYIPYQVPTNTPIWDWTKVTCNGADEYGVYFLNDNSIGRAVLEFESSIEGEN